MRLRSVASLQLENLPKADQESSSRSGSERFQDSKTGEYEITDKIMKLKTMAPRPRELRNKGQTLLT